MLSSITNKKCFSQSALIQEPNWKREKKHPMSKEKLLQKAWRTAAQENLSCWKAQDFWTKLSLYGLMLFSVNKKTWIAKKGKCNSLLTRCQLEAMVQRDCNYHDIFVFVQTEKEKKKKKKNLRVTYMKLCSLLADISVAPESLLAVSTRPCWLLNPAAELWSWAAGTTRCCFCSCRFCWASFKASLMNRPSWVR